MSTLERREPHGLFPDLFDWLESPLSMLRPELTQAIRVENYIEGDDYVIRAELPGMDPDRDVEITVSAGVLNIHAERREEHKETHRSEFRYGSFTRSMALPSDVDPDAIKAGYDKGILTVRVPMSRAAKEEAKRITIQKEAAGGKEETSGEK
ncbi:Hsp20/alpha crystallin family protein [Actinomadura viridis]|uniref:Hsp20/alpha crystallin family protein n=1 Tax=Actinomadura viridis TaxID=58110 RepID=UPI0036818659